MDEYVVVAFDLEGSGQYVLTDPVTEIGAVVVNMDNGKVLQKFEHMGHCRMNDFFLKKTTECSL